MFENPYKDCDYYSHTGSRITADLDKEDFNFIRALRPRDGTLQTTVNLLWQKLVEELKSRGIVPYSEANRKAFEEFVTTCRFMLPSEIERAREEATEKVVEEVAKKALEDAAKKAMAEGKSPLCNYI